MNLGGICVDTPKIDGLGRKLDDTRTPPPSREKSCESIVGRSPLGHEESSRREMRERRWEGDLTSFSL
jgi:hypothetical protein